MTSHIARTGCAVLAALGVATACSSTGGLFPEGPRPPELAGIWIDVVKTTPTDTLAWLLESDGADRTLEVRYERDESGVMSRQEHKRSYGFWYMDGRLQDTSSRAVCFKPHPRAGPTCYRFRVDTLATSPPRRRLTVLGYRGNHSTADRVLVERLP